MPWRKITAEQYLRNDDAEGFDEARIVNPATGMSREVWDVGETDNGQIAIYTAAAGPLIVPHDYPISVR